MLHGGLKGEGAGVGNEGESLRSSDEITESSQDDGDRVRICMQAVTVGFGRLTGKWKKIVLSSEFPNPHRPLLFPHRVIERLLEVEQQHSLSLCAQACKLSALCKVRE